MVAELSVDTHEPAAFAPLDICSSSGLTCANPSAALPNQPFDCGSYDLVASPDMVACGQACSATECCVAQAQLDNPVVPAEAAADAAAMSQAEHILNSVVVTPIVGCDAYAEGDEADLCKRPLQPLEVRVWSIV